MINYTLPKPKDFEHNIDGKNTHLLTLTNRTGMQIALTDYGARLVSALVPDKYGNLVDVILGFDSIQGYLRAQEKYHGATAGRFCNRIANGKFTLEGQKYTLAQNNGSNSLHGGPGGFHERVWDRQVSFKKKIDFYYVSPDGEEGFPGELKTNVSYELTNENEIVIQFRATTDKTTVLNLTNHAYFNLNGEGNGDTQNHILHIPSEKFIPINAQQIPIGEEYPVRGTAFDFTTPKKIVKDLHAEEEQLRFAHGYDHTFVNIQPINTAAATAYAEQSGISLEVFTSEPGVHLYTGNFLTDDKGKSGHKYLKYGGFCLETQHYPDSPNHPDFPNVILHPGEVFESKTIYKFGVRK
ncbi:aldose epimerase family protein [Parapedobacter sp. SGR-10]|uniref:aldose epimerase family protein n=1 Tax=Parapedobacter sp. SGR-10 TaxID=2710879 RepID=UPI00197DC6F8|nr:aldose epimerase family protein [Parapedobacter sp. SGR-10]